MSSLFSDPPFARGTTLLSGEVIEYSAGTTYSTQVPAAGVEVVGQIKAFMDSHPVTKARLSNELVYCVAARFKPAASDTVLNPNNDGTARGKAVVLRMSSGATNLLSTAEFTDTYATNANVTAGQRVGYIDEYLTSEIRANDIVWVTVRGPAMVAKTTNAAINSGTLVTVTGTAGLSVTASTVLSLTEAAPNTLNQQAMGLAIGSVNTTTNVVTLGGNAASADTLVRAILYGVNWNI